MWGQTYLIQRDKKGAEHLASAYAAVSWPARRFCCFIFYIASSFQVVAIAALLYTVLHLHWLHTCFSFKNARKIQSMIVFNAKANKWRIWRYFAKSKPESRALQLPCTVWVNQCDSDSSLTRFCENHCQAVLRCKWLLRNAIAYASNALKPNSCKWLPRFDFLGGMSSNISQTKSYTNLLPCK